MAMIRRRNIYAGKINQIQIKSTVIESPLKIAG